jgi:hypothetical protein
VLDALPAPSEEGKDISIKFWTDIPMVFGMSVQNPT